MWDGASAPPYHGIPSGERFRGDKVMGVSCLPDGPGCWWRRGARVLSYAASAAALAIVALAGCDKGPPAKGVKNPRVVVTKPTHETVIDYQDFTGRLDAVKTVDVRAR